MGLKENKIYPKWRADVGEDCKLYIRDRQTFDRHLIPYIGKEVNVIVKDPVKDRSRQEEKYYHAVVCRMVGETLSISRQEAHRLMAELFLKTEEKEKLPDGRTIRYVRVMSTTELGDKRYDEYVFKECVPWAALPAPEEGEELDTEHGLGLYIPLPNEVDYEQYI